MKLLFLMFINFILLSSCKKYKQSEAAFFMQTPAVYVDAINNKGTSVFQGTSSNKITDLFLYVNGQFQGIYPVGNTMPIINKNQSATINIFAGIKNNGIGATRIPYPLYDYVTIDTLVDNGKTFVRPLTFKYGSGAVFAMIEDFEPGNNGNKMIKSPSSEVNFKLVSNEDKFEGRSLLLELPADSNAIFAQIESTIGYPLPVGSANVFLELNYKCNTPFSAGVLADAEVREAVILNPQSSWNKIYIQLSSVVSAAPVSLTYKIYFRLIKTTDYPNPKLFLDNIKVLHL
jgi:hypothetical protein